jgi:glycolate oxidase
VRVGGSVTGEHGIGVEKIDFMPVLFTPEDLHMMLRLRSAFNPDGRCSPAKMLPTAGACIEPSKAGRRAAL